MIRKKKNPESIISNFVILQRHSNKKSIVLHQNGHIDPANKIKDPCTNLPSYNHVIFDKTPKIHIEESKRTNKKFTSTHAAEKIGYGHLEE